MEKKYPIGIEPNLSKHQDIIVKVCKAHGVKSLELTTKHIELMADCISEYIAQQAPTAVWVKAKERSPSKEHNYFVKATTKFQGYNHNDTALWRNNKWEFDRKNGRIVVEWLDEAAGAINVDPDELWDEFSEIIDDDIDSLTRWAGSAVLTREGWRKMMEKLK